MAERHRHRARAVAVDDGKVGVAEAGGLDPDQQLVAAGRGQLDFLDMQGLAVGIGPGKPDLVQDGGFGLHRFLPRVAFVCSWLAALIDNRLRQPDGWKTGLSVTGAAGQAVAYCFPVTPPIGLRHVRPSNNR
jgi:hypothetical protein